jgi:ubiquinone/menaquinone biosynthesis C-methylase UbiE
MLRQCLKDLKKFKCEAKLFLGNAEELPFGNKSFDALFHAGGMNFLLKRKRVF